MRIAGLTKLSTVDYPGKLCAVVFVPGCNMRCWYCHNRALFSGPVPLIPQQEALGYLKRRANLLEGVVLTGGEPTLRPDLAAFAAQCKAFGYSVKLDTNGTQPRVLESLLRRKLLDYVAMDVKAPEALYDATCCAAVSLADIRRSIALLMDSGVEYEFRTTFAPTLKKEDILAIAPMIAGAKRYFLQQYRPRFPHPGEPPMLAQPLAHEPEYVLETARKMRAVLGVCQTRGL